ncbi:MAG: hypothetical protein ACFHWX_03685 [Bacteroidota bacterium]
MTPIRRWMLQDAYNIKPDVLVLNIDFLLLKSFRERIFNELDIPPFELDEVNVNEYRTNWKNVVQHLLGHYKNDRPIYIGLTVSNEWYEGFEENLQLYGLTYKFKAEVFDVAKVNREIYERYWDLHDINMAHEDYYANSNVANMNRNYLKPLKAIYDQYLQSGESSKASSVRNMAMGIADRTLDERLVNQTDSLFKQ